MEAILARCATLADGLARAGGVRALAPLKEAVRGVARASASAAAAGEALSEALIQDLWGTACSIWVSGVRGEEAAPEGLKHTLISPQPRLSPVPPKTERRV